MKAPRLRVVLLLAIALAGGGLYAARTAVLVHIGSFLIVKDQLLPADLIFVLNGDHETRPAHAAQLLQAGLAPRIVVARSERSPAEQLGIIENDTQTSVRVLHSAGVPPDRIVEIETQGGVTSTFDEAAVLAKYCAANGLHSVIVVTSELHTRRTRWIARKLLSAQGVRITVSGAADRRYTGANWWKNEEGLIACQNEYLKFIYYWLKYRKL